MIIDNIIEESEEKYVYRTMKTFEDDPIFFTLYEYLQGDSYRCKMMYVDGATNIDLIIPGLQFEDNGDSIFMNKSNPFVF